MKRLAIVLTVFAALAVAANSAHAQTPAMSAAIQMSAAAVAHGPDSWDHRHYGEHHHPGGYYHHDGYRAPTVVLMPTPVPPPPAATYYAPPPCTAVYLGTPGLSIRIGF